MKSSAATSGPSFVIDASVVVKLFVAEPLSDQVEALFNKMTDDPAIRFFVPELLYAECANIFWKYVQRYQMPQGLARRNLENLMNLSLDRLPLVGLIPSALPLALRHAITVYDACYLSASRLTKSPLITADERLIRKLATFKPNPITIESALTIL